MIMPIPEKSVCKFNLNQINILVIYSFSFYIEKFISNLARSGMGAEFMQPVLEQLQPSIDFVDNFEPIQSKFILFFNYSIQIKHLIYLFFFLFYI